MGASFANVHVALGSVDPDAALPNVGSAIVDWMSSRGFSPTVDGDPEPDRSVLFGVDPRGDWINVYDQWMDLHEDHQAFASLASALASRIGTTAVATSVFDSDLAWLGLFEPLGQIAELVHGFESGEFAPSLAPDYESWRSILRPGVQPQDLRTVWTFGSGDSNDRYVFAEDRVADACELLGIDKTMATLGYRYLVDPQSGVDLSTLRRLGFSTQRKDVDVAEAEVDEAWLFPTGLLLVSDDDTVRLPPFGQPVSLSANIVNARPYPIDGLRVSLSSTNDRLFTLSSVDLTHLCKQREHRKTAVPSAGPTPVAVAVLQDFHLDSWPQLTGSARYGLTLNQVQHSQGMIVIHGHVHGYGSGSIELEVEAMTGRQGGDDGRASVTFRMRSA